MNPVTLIIPVYNEAKGIGPTAERARVLLLELPPGSEVILVDDGSTDATSSVLDSLAGEGLRVLRHQRNRGYGRALKTGIRAAVNDLIAICDADGTYPLERIPEFTAPVDAGLAAMTVGHRPVHQQPAVRRPAKAFLKALAQYLTGEIIPDLNSGLRVFRRRDARRLENLLPDGFSFTTTITMALLSEGERVEYIPIRYKRRVGRSKIKPIRDTANFLLLICRTTLAFQPMKVFGPIGVCVFLTGCFLLAARVVLDHAFGVATTVTMLIGGLQIMAIGLLADLINRRGTPED